MNYRSRNHTIWYVVQVEEVERATQFLEGQGYDVTNMIGGMLAWEGETVKNILK